MCRVEPSDQSEGSCEFRPASAETCDLINSTQRIQFVNGHFPFAIFYLKPPWKMRNEKRSTANGSFPAADGIHSHLQTFEGGQRSRARPSGLTPEVSALPSTGGPPWPCGMGIASAHRFVRLPVGQSRLSEFRVLVVRCQPISLTIVSVWAFHRLRSSPIASRPRFARLASNQ